MDSLSTSDEIVSAAQRALDLAPAAYPTDLPAPAELRGAPGWYPFEHTAWAIGESIRHAFVTRPALKSRPEVWNAVLRVIEQSHLRRGRQSFVLLLGTVKAQPYATRLAPFLSDPDIAGHVIDALTKMRAGGYSAQVQKHLNAKQTWIRRKAKVYVERFAV